MSCDNAAAATMAPKSFERYPFSFNSGYFSRTYLPTMRPKDLATTETSRLCVSLVCTKSVLESGTTCVLSCKLLKESEKIILSKSTSKPRRASSWSILFLSDWAPNLFNESNFYVQYDDNFKSYWIYWRTPKIDTKQHNMDFFC